jgi:hypothetical protein
MPHLSQFFAAYFHEDWQCDDPTADEVVRRFMRDAGSEVPKALADLLGLLSSTADEHELEQVIFRLGAYYLPTADGWTWRGWLEHVRSMLSGNE